MLKIQVSIPEMKALAESVRSMAVDPMTTLQTLAGDAGKKVHSPSPRPGDDCNGKALPSGQSARGTSEIV